MFYTGNHEELCISLGVPKGKNNCYNKPMHESIFNDEFRHTFYLAFREGVEKVMSANPSDRLPDYADQEILKPVRQKLKKAIVDRITAWGRHEEPSYKLGDLNNESNPNITDYLNEGLEDIVKPKDGGKWGLLGEAIHSHNGGNGGITGPRANIKLNTIFDHYKNKKISKMRCFIQQNPNP